MKTLKYIFLSILFAITLSVNAQNNPMDVIETTITKKAFFENEHGDLVEKKVKIIERRTQKVKTKPSEKYLLNQSRMKTPVQVVKTIMIDSDDDKLYDSTAVVAYKVKNDSVTDMAVNTSRGFGRVQKTRKKIDDQKRNVYVFGSDDTAIYGYIDDDNNFIVDAF